jgi:hypothetical protein
MTNNRTVSTDKSNYSPGDIVVITATGFGVGSTITFAIEDDPNDPGDDGEADVYKPFSVTDGGSGDSDGIPDGQVLVAWRVPTDNNGTGSGIPDALNATLNLTATGPDGQAATTMFMDAINTSLKAWAEGGTQPAEWQQGALVVCQIFICGLGL